MGQDTVVVGSEEDRKVRKERLKSRFDQAMEAIADEGVFSPDQITTLHNAFVLMRWGIEETI